MVLQEQPTVAVISVADDEKLSVKGQSHNLYLQISNWALSVYGVGLRTNSMLFIRTE